MSKLSSNSKSIQRIARYRYGSKIILDYHHKDGDFKNCSYNKSYLDEIQYFKINKSEFGFDIEYLKFYKVINFFKFIFKNIKNLIIMLFYIQIKLIIIGLKKFIIQFKEINSIVKEYNPNNINMKFMGWLHYFLCLIFTPIKYYIELIFIEHSERYLSASSTLTGYIISKFLILVIQLILIIFILIFIILYIGFLILKFIIILIFKLFNFIFKPIEVSSIE